MWRGCGNPGGRVRIQAFVGSMYRWTCGGYRRGCPHTEGAHNCPCPYGCDSASAEVLKECIARLPGHLIDAGATISPGCGPVSAPAGSPGRGECALPPQPEFSGQDGSRDSAVYLASPATVAMSALTGYLTDPSCENQGQAERQETEQPGKWEIMKKENLQARPWPGNAVDTDQIYPGRYLALPIRRKSATA